MSRKPKVQRTPEEKWQIVLEGLKSGNVAETCRKYGRSHLRFTIVGKSITPSLARHRTARACREQNARAQRSCGTTTGAINYTNYPQNAIVGEIGWCISLNFR
jgi:transposase-like protein